MASQILDHFFIMDDRSVGKISSLPGIVLSVGIRYLPHASPETESCCLCKFDTHIMQFLSLPTLSICTDLRSFSPLRQSSCPSCLQELHPPPAFQRCDLTRHISAVTLFNVMCDLFQITVFPFSLQFLVTSLSSRLNACRQIYYFTSACGRTQVPMSLPSMITFCVFARFCCIPAVSYALPELRRLQMPYFPPLHFRRDEISFPFRYTCCTASSYAIVTSASLHASITFCLLRLDPFIQKMNRKTSVHGSCIYVNVSFFLCYKLRNRVFPAPAGPSIATLYPMVSLLCFYFLFYSSALIPVPAAYAVDQAI